MMTTLKEEKTETITHLLNGTGASIKNVVPLSVEMNKPSTVEGKLDLEFGVLIGMTGDIKGKLILAGKSNVFSVIGETMFGMPVEGEMLSSFSGELGNMIAGGLSTNLTENGLSIDITAPTVMEGNMSIRGYKTGVQVPVSFEKAGDLSVFLLLD